MKLAVIDKYTFKLTFGDPRPLLPIMIAKTGAGGPPCGPSFAYPEHYMKKFLPKNTPQAELDALAKSKGVTSWTQLWGNAGDQEGPIAFWFKNPDRPVISAWKTKVSPLTDQNRYRRWIATPTSGRWTPMAINFPTSTKSATTCMTATRSSTCG